MVRVAVHTRNVNLLIIIAEPGYYEDGKFGIRIESKSSK